MSNYSNPGSNPNPWNLDELEYCGDLYHYTNKMGYEGIFYHTDCPDFPSDCISLRFKQIDYMAKKNDPNERKHIDKAVKKIALQLFERGEIGVDFLEIVHDYEPTRKGFYRMALDKMDNQCHTPQILMDFGPVDYYVACFSSNPSNTHIVREFEAPIKVTFSKNFSSRCSNPFSCEIVKNGPITFIDGTSSTYPMQSIRGCFLDTFLRKVEYIDTSASIKMIRSELIEKRLMAIYKKYVEHPKPKLDEIQNDVEDMYSLCDAFVKDIQYKPEEEIRFVIRLPQKEYFLNKYGRFPTLLATNHVVFDEDRTYLQLPISDEFITLW